MKINYLILLSLISMTSVSSPNKNKCDLHDLIIDREEITRQTLSPAQLEKTFFTADAHFSHANIIRFSQRPFRDITHMREILIRNWNRVVPADGTVYVVGDFSMNLETVQSVLPRLMGRKILIAGNHDLCHGANQKCRSPQDLETYTKEYLDAGFDEVLFALELKVPDRDPFLVSHYPYEFPVPPLSNPSNAPYLLADDNKTALVCGHVHCAWKIKDRMVNVGVDVQEFRPISAKELLGLLPE